MYTLDLRLKIREFLDGKISLHALEDYYLPLLESFITDETSDACDLISALDLAVIDFNSNVVDLPGLRNRLELSLKLPFIFRSTPEENKTRSEGNLVYYVEVGHKPQPLMKVISCESIPLL